MFGGHRGGPGEAFALIVRDELVVGQPALMQIGALALQIRLGMFSTRLLSSLT